MRKFLCVNFFLLSISAFSQGEAKTEIQWLSIEKAEELAKNRNEENWAWWLHPPVCCVDQCVLVHTPKGKKGAKVRKGLVFHTVIHESTRRVFLLHTAKRHNIELGS